MKRLIYLLLLFPVFAQAQINGTIQKTSATGTVRGNFGSLGLDTLPRVNGILLNGRPLVYNSVLNKWTASLLGTSGIDTSATGLRTVANSRSLAQTQTVLNLKANLASPSFTGTVNLGTTLNTGSIAVNGIGANNNNLDDIGTSGGNIFKKLWINDVNINSLTASRVLVSDAFKNISSSATTATELGYVSGVTSAIQTQLNSKVGLTSFSATAPITYNNGTGVFSIADGAISNAKLANSTISGIALGANLPALTFGTYLTGTSYNGTGAVSLATNASTIGSASSLVATDASSNITGSAYIANGSTVFTATNQAAGSVQAVMANTAGSLLTGVYNNAGTGFGATVITGMTANGTGFGSTTATPVQLFTNGVVRQTIAATGATSFTAALSASNLSGTNTGDQTITLTGAVTGSGTGSFATSLGSFSSANLATAITDETGTGSAVFATSPSLTTPAIGAATGSSLVLSGNITAANIGAGNYTPTLTNGANVSSSSATNSTWIRIGNVVSVQGFISVNNTATISDTFVDISLPVASNLTGSTQLNGVAPSQATTDTIVIYGNTTDDRAQCYFTPTSTGAKSYGFSFSYQIL